jgi:sugar phosphate isomerase/epimerase
MNIVLEFGDDETKDAEIALNGWKWKLAMYDLDQILRSTVKHGVSIIEKNKQATDAEMDVADKIREELREILQNYNLDLND